MHLSKNSVFTTFYFIFISMIFKNISDEELKTVIANSINWSDAIRKCGRRKSGASFQNFQVRVKKLGCDISHFLGRATHTGFRHTGKAKKKHWSKMLIEKLYHERERNGRFRQAYTEYCIETSVEIKCVDCGNKGEWLGKKLRLQINHKNSKHSDNRPENLEWCCPNCHDLKTIY